MTRILLFLIITSVPAFAQDEEGKYTATSNGSGVGVWVVDTETGAVKLCTPQRSNEGDPGVSCTPFVE